MVYMYSMCNTGGSRGFQEVPWNLPWLLMYVLRTCTNKGPEWPNEQTCIREQQEDILRIERLAIHTVGDAHCSCTDSFLAILAC